MWKWDIIIFVDFASGVGGKEKVYITSKLKIFNKNYKGLGTTEKEKKQEETQTGR